MNKQTPPQEDCGCCAASSGQTPGKASLRPAGDNSPGKAGNDSSAAAENDSSARAGNGASGPATRKKGPAFLARWSSAIASALLLAAGLLMDQYHAGFFEGTVRLAWYLLAYLPVGFPVLRKAVRTISEGEVFTEFFLMSIATAGAFALGEYPEGVAVMLFYAVGELFQGAAVRRARYNITALLDVRPDTAVVLRNGLRQTVDPREVAVGETVQVRAGEKVPLDGILSGGGSHFNTVALTGESRPRAIREEEQVLAGMINMENVVHVRTTRKFADSSVARILDLVQHAASRKARTEQFIRRFARIYTPAVTFLAVGLVFLPYFFTEEYVFSDWLYRGLVFLVISCPCALVIAIPLGYFGGIGAASRNGILFKGSSYLDLLTRVNTMILDKTGTLTEGVFEVKEISTEQVGNERLVRLTAALESRSTHPVARAVCRYAREKGLEQPLAVEAVEEIPGLGMKGKVDGSEILAGNARLLERFNVPLPSGVQNAAGGAPVLVALDGRYAGQFLIADKIREDAADAVRQLRRNGIRETILLSGDKSEVVEETARILGIDKAFGDLLPEDKVRKLEELKTDRGRVAAFVGDGINDAPALALSDVGIAMGGLGSDAAIETADVVIQTDRLPHIATAIRIGKATRRIVWQNIFLAFGVKAAVLILGAAGMAGMWEAVFADVGVALLAILNAVRIQKMNFLLPS